MTKNTMNERPDDVYPFPGWMGVVAIVVATFIGVYFSSSITILVLEGVAVIFAAYVLFRQFRFQKQGRRKEESV